MRQSNHGDCAAALAAAVFLVSSSTSSTSHAGAGAGSGAGGAAVHEAPVGEGGPGSPGEAGSPWLSCLHGFSPREDDPRLDVLRLGVACGPVTGLSRLARVSSQVDEGGPPSVLRFTAERRDCLRVFAVAGAGADDLEVEMVGPHGARIALSNQNRRWVVALEGAPFCVPVEGDYEARFSTHAGRAPLAAVVYRGRNMQTRGSGFVPTTGSGSDIPY